MAWPVTSARPPIEHPNHDTNLGDLKVQICKGELVVDGPGVDAVLLGHGDLNIGTPAHYN